MSRRELLLDSDLSLKAEKRAAPPALLQEGNLPPFSLRGRQDAGKCHFLVGP